MPLTMKSRSPGFTSPSRRASRTSSGSVAARAIRLLQLHAARPAARAPRAWRCCQLVLRPHVGVQRLPVEKRPEHDARRARAAASASGGACRPGSPDGPGSSYATSTLITFVEPGRLTAVPAVSHDAVARVDDARLARRLERARPEVLDVLGLRHQHRRDAPLERHLLHRGLVVRQPDDRPARPQPGDGRRGAAGEGRHEDRARVAAPRRGRRRRSTSRGRRSARRPARASGGGSPSTARPRARCGPSSRPPRPDSCRSRSRPRA